MHVDQGLQSILVWCYKILKVYFVALFQPVVVDIYAVFYSHLVIVDIYAVFYLHRVSPDCPCVLSYGKHHGNCGHVLMPQPMTLCVNALI